MSAADLRLIDYVLGLLPEAERRRIDRDRLRLTSVARKIRQFETLLDEYAPPEPIELTAPLPGIFARAMRQIVADAPSSPWVEMVPGVFQHRLWNDRTHLVRCGTGVVIPAHRHPSDELFVVLDGEVVIGDCRFGTGDAERSPRGSYHDEGRALRECVFLVQLARSDS